MSDKVGKPTRAPHLRVIINEDFVNETEEAAIRFADHLETEYKAITAGRPLAFANSITVNDYPDECVVARAVEILDARGYDADPVEHECAGGRAGSIRVSARDPHQV